MSPGRFQAESGKSPGCWLCLLSSLFSHWSREKSFPGVGSANLIGSDTFEQLPETMGTIGLPANPKPGML